MVFETILSNMQSMGFFQYLFPFLLSLAILYGVMKFAVKDRLGGDKPIALISLILSFFVMLWTSANPGVVSFLTGLSGSGILIAGSGILFFLIILGLMGFKTENLTEIKYGKEMMILAVLFIAGVIFFGVGGQALVPTVSLGTEFWTIVFFVVILALVMVLLGGEGEEGGGEKSE